jgi:hypothetical protein
VLYNSPVAPDYDVANISVPTTFLYAESDQLTVPEASKHFHVF